MKRDVAVLGTLIDVGLGLVDRILRIPLGFGLVLVLHLLGKGQ